MIPPAAGGLYPTCFADFVGNLVKLRGRREKREREREGQVLSPSWLAISRLSSAFRASSRITTKDGRRLAESIDPSTSVSPSPGERGRCQSSILRNNPFFGEQSFPVMNFKGNRSSCWYRDCYGNCYRTVCIVDWGKGEGRVSYSNSVNRFVCCYRWLIILLLLRNCLSREFSKEIIRLNRALLLLIDVTTAILIYPFCFPLKTQIAKWTNFSSFLHFVIIL